MFFHPNRHLTKGAALPLLREEAEHLFARDSLPHGHRPETWNAAAGSHLLVPAHGAPAAARPRWPLCAGTVGRCRHAPRRPARAAAPALRSDLGQGFGARSGMVLELGVRVRRNSWRGCKIMLISKSSRCCCSVSLVALFVYPRMICCQTSEKNLTISNTASQLWAGT